MDSLAAQMQTRLRNDRLPPLSPPSFHGLAGTI